MATTPLTITVHRDAQAIEDTTVSLAPRAGLGTVSIQVGGGTGTKTVTLASAPDWAVGAYAASVSHNEGSWSFSGFAPPFAGMDGEYEIAVVDSATPTPNEAKASFVVETALPTNVVRVPVFEGVDRTIDPTVWLRIVDASHSFGNKINRREVTVYKHATSGKLLFVFDHFVGAKAPAPRYDAKVAVLPGDADRNTICDVFENDFSCDSNTFTSLWTTIHAAIPPAPLP